MIKAENKNICCNNSSLSVVEIQFPSGSSIDVPLLSNSELPIVLLTNDSIDYDLQDKSVFNEFVELINKLSEDLQTEIILFTYDDNLRRIS